MNMKLGSKLCTIIAVTLFLLLVACNSSADMPEDQASANPEDADITLAMVDTVSVEPRDNQFYAIIQGFYPDACTSISSVEQSVQDRTISITLLTDRPADLVCAAVLTPFTIDILLTTGGLMPAEYSVIVNEAPSTTFLLE